MKIDEFKKLENRINNHNFNESYRGIHKIVVALSYFGHVVSIFLAYFFMSKVLSAASDNQFAVGIASLVILGGLELLKRDIFDKFSIQSLKDGSLLNGAFALMISSLLLISGSFYSSINGAKEFSYKEKEIEVKTELKINEIKDSIILSYAPRLEVLETQNKELFDANKLLDEEARQLPSTWVSYKNKIRSRIDVNNEQIDKNDNKISLLKKERDSKIEEIEEDLTSKSDENKEENSKNSFIFVIISTLIELVILGGVYFSEYYKFRSYKEFRDKIEKDPNYQKWLLYDQILSIIITEETKMNEKLPSNKAIIEMCKLNDIIVLPKDINNFLKVVVGLGIIKASGSVKYINKSLDIAKLLLRKSFNIV